VEVSAEDLPGGRSRHRRRERRGS